MKSKKPNNKLLFGNMVHKYLEHYNRRISHPEEGRASACNVGMEMMRRHYYEADTQYADQVELQGLWELAVDVVKNYDTQWGEEDSKKLTLATELEFLVRLDGDIFYTGTIDWVFEDEEGRLWFSDHKTTDSIDKYAKNSVMDRQISRYWWALQMLCQGVGRIRNKETGQWEEATALKGKEVYGFIYNIIVRDVPHAPKLLKSGQLSKDKSQKTTLDLYTQALKDSNLIAYMDDERIDFPSEYDDILDHLAQQGNRYFRRIDVTRLQPEVDASIMELFAVAQDMEVLSDMARQGQNQMIYRNITSDCSWDCEFRGLCELQITGGNTQLLMDLNFELNDQITQRTVLQ